MQDNLAYRYFAFISYSSKDKKIAEKIHNKIEAYRLPTVLRNELEAATGKKYPQRVRPLFRDMTDLSAGLLGKSILRELEDSRYLLVICSPESAKSEWVNQEVENFILMGRYERIIPYIIEGTPNSGNPATECFPPILRKNREFITYSHLSPEENAERQAKLHAILDEIHDELKGVSLSGEGAKVSRLKVIARMLEVSPDTLIQRDKQRQKKKILWSSITAMFFVILFACLGLWTWDRYYRVHVGYFADYVEYWGVPRGIFPLSVEQRAHREAHYRIYTKNWQVIRLEHVNSVGTPIPIKEIEFKDRPMIAVYPIYNDGRLVQRDTLDNNGKVVMSLLYSGDKMQKVEFRSFANDKTASSTVLTNFTSLTNSLLDNSLDARRGEIGNMRLIRDTEGRVIEERFHRGNYDVPVTDEQGIAGFRYNLDEYGRVIEKIYLDQDGTPHPDKHGIVRLTYQYDKDGNIYETKFFDKKGNLISNEFGWMHCINEFDNYGNLVKTRNVDSSGKLYLENNQTAGRTYSYNEHGNNTEMSFFDSDDNPCQCDVGYAKIALKYDERGNVIETAYIDINDSLCLCEEGYAKVIMKHDERGNVIEMAYFGIDDKPCCHKDGFSKLKLKFDEQGYIIGETYFNIDDQPCLCDTGYAKSTAKIDDQGNVTELAYYGLDNKLIMNKYGFAKITGKFDERRNIIEMVFWGIDGKPCLCDDNYSKVTRQFDEHGNLIKAAFFGIDGKPCYRKNGYSKIALKYDERGNVIEDAYFDIDDRPCLCDNGYAKTIVKYDKYGNQIEVSYFGIDDHLCLCNDGYARISMIRNKRGDIIEQSFWGQDDQPCLCKNGVSKATAKYDEDGNMYEISYFDIAGQPCQPKDIDKEQKGTVKILYLDNDYKPCMKKNGVIKVIYKNDEHGNITEISFFDKDNKPCLNKLGGWAKAKAKYDKHGNNIENTYFGVDNQPCLCKDGFFKDVRDYDEFGNIINITYYDIHGNRMNTYVIVVEVSTDSNGEKFGIQDGDYFILYDGQPVDDDDSFIEKRSKETGDDPHELVVLRNNEFVVIQTHPGLLGCSLTMQTLSEEQQKLVLEKLKEMK